jgi:hypothetical protein
MKKIKKHIEKFLINQELKDKIEINQFKKKTPKKVNP